MENDWGESPESVTHTAPRRRYIPWRMIGLVLAVGSAIVGGWVAAELRLRWQQAAQIPQSRLPADFEHTDAVLLNWSEQENGKCQRAIIEMARLLSERADVVLMVDADDELAARNELQAAGVNLARVQLVPTNAERSAWARDLPLCAVEDFQGGQGLLLADDEQRVRKLFVHSDVSVRLWPHLDQAGPVLSNGLGLGLATRTLANSLGDRVSEFQSELNKYWAVDELVWLEPLTGEPTGRAEVFVMFASADTVLVGQCAASVDPVNAAILDRNAQQLAQLRTAAGPLRVQRIPMPPRNQHQWPSYTTALLLNRTILFPHYEQVPLEVEQEARGVFAEVLPGWKLLAVNADEVVKQEGSLRRACQPFMYRGASLATRGRAVGDR